MKNKFYLLLIVVISACKPATNKVSTSTKFGESSHLDSLILGEWSMCSSSSGTGDTVMMTQVNVCTKWLFNANHSGFVGLEKPVFKFDWEIVGNTLKIKNKVGDNFISNGDYILTEQQDPIHRTIILADTANKWRDFLVK